MTLLGVEARRVGTAVLRTGIIWWLLAAVVVVPCAGAVIVSRTMGPPPLLEFAIWLAVAPLVPLLWVYAGMRLGEQDESTRVGALKRALPASRGVLWLTDAAVTSGIGVAGALLTTLCLVVAIPAWHAGGFGGVAAGSAWTIGVLASTYGLMLVWGKAWRSLLPAGWSGPAAFLLPLFGFVASFMTGSDTPFSRASDPVGFMNLLATDPWGYFIQKAGDIWGFGAYEPLALQVMVVLVVALLIGTGMATARQLGGSRRMTEGMAVGACLVVGVIVLMAGEITALATPSSAPTAWSSIRQQGVRRELVHVMVGLSRGIRATATVWPGHAGLSALFLNPHLRVVAVRMGGRPVVYARRASGWIRFPDTHKPLSVSYEGDPLVVVRATGAEPVVSSFANGSGAMLTGGGWYPLSGEAVARPLNPPVLPYGLQVTDAGPGVAVTNIGAAAAGLQWRTTTGLVVYAGRLTPVKLPGMVLWSGPSASAVWAGNFWAPMARDATDAGHLYFSPGRPQLRAEFRFFGGGSPATVVSLPWLAVPQTMAALGNPNTVLAPGIGPVPVDTASGAFGFLTSMGRTYETLARAFAGQELAGLWPHWSPAWIMTDPRSVTGGDARFPAYQRPTLGLFSILESSWVGFSQWYAPWPLQPPPWVVSLSALPSSAGERVWRRFLPLVAHGRWPGWRQVKGLAPARTVRP